MGDPAVSVVIATYNWSTALRWALRSVLAQTFADFEVRVVGDGCTDDSAEVVASFDDPRVHWENLPRNSGSQSVPNNRGVETARGAWIAYLGHDDLWHPTHLERLVAATEREDADVWFSLALILHPNGGRAISGLFQDGVGTDQDIAVPSSLFHRRDLFERVGGWSDWHETSVPHDIEWQQRARRRGARFRAVEHLSVFKFTSSMRRDSYRLRRSDEQQEWWRRIAEDPDLPRRELVEVLRGALYGFDARVRPPLAVAGAPPGFLVRQMRWIRGLEPDLAPMERLPEEVGARSLPLIAEEIPARMAAGDQIRLRVRVRNDAPCTVSSHHPYPVHLSYRWLTAAGEVVEADGLRSVLEPALAPGDEHAFECVVRAPARTGELLLLLSLVQEGVRWLDEAVPEIPRVFAIQVEERPTAAE